MFVPTIQSNKSDLLIGVLIVSERQVAVRRPVVLADTLI